MDDWLVALRYRKGQYFLFCSQCWLCASCSWRTLHCLIQNAYIRSLQLFIAPQNAEMCFIRELVNMTQTAGPCCAAAARQFCPFHPSFPLLIDESVIFGGKLLRIWSWSLVIFDCGELSLVHVRVWNHTSLTGMSSILCFSHPTWLERYI